VFDQLRTSFSDSAAQKGLRLRVRATPVWVRSDPLLLHRVLLNLLSNATQHTHSGGVLLVCRPSHQEGHVRIQVRDSGIGIAQQHQQKVFEEFYQVENPERDRSKGLGMGLSIVERSCKLLNHPISLRSAPGRGSTFTLLVPIGQVQLDVRATLQETLNSQELKGMRVLLIEDDPLGRAALRGLLDSWGCCVVDASTAQAAMERWNRQQPPHFIVTDYRLVGAHNGVDAVHLLRQIAGHEVAACIISGDADVAVRNQINAAGLMLLQKPVKPAKLRNVLRHFWSARSVPNQEP
jgi:CheY-like chemotaxis protein